MKRTIEIEDVLEDHVDSLIEQVQEELESYLDSNKPDKCPEWGDVDFSGALHERVDGAVPIYTHQIEAAWYLYGSELEEAYEDAGIGDNPRENNGMGAIYCYLERKAMDWWIRNAEDIFNAWQEKREKE